jgi:rod shape-determining protein MreC
MVSSSDRRYTRRDTVLLILCLGLSLFGLFSPVPWGHRVADTLRETVLSPLVWLQTRAEEGRTSRVRFRQVTSERDSTAYLAQFLPSLRAENERLRQLLRLGRRLNTGYVSAEVLHQPQVMDGRTLLLGVGAREGVTEFSPVVSPEGLIGVVLSVTRKSSVAMSWAHPEFRVSAFTISGNAFGVVAPSNEGRNGEGALEFRGVPYRDSVPLGTLVLSSGLGGVFPKGVPVGTVIGTVREEAGWERVYRLRPAANPGSAAHVLVLVGGRSADLSSAFPSDSLLEAQRLDSIARLRRADSVAQAVKAARAARRDSLQRASPLQGTVGAPAQRSVPVSPMQGGSPSAPPRAHEDSAQ